MAAKPSDTARAVSRSARLKESDNEPQGQALFDLANLRPERTGLPFVGFMSQKGGARHDVRVKIASGPKVKASEMATVAVRPAVRVMRGAVDPADLALLTEWIGRNRDVLVAYWNGDIEYTEDAIAALQPLPQ